MMRHLNSIILFFAMLATAAVAVFLTLYLQPFKQEPLFVDPNMPVNVFSGSEYAEDRMEVRLYYLASDHEQLVIERREIPATTVIKQKVEFTLQAWLTGPVDKSLIHPVPSGTELLSVFWDSNERMMYVNFNDVIIKNAPGHALAEWGTIYSIVNTVAAQSPMIQKVWILVDGQPVSDEYTIWDWSVPFRANDTFVKKQTLTNTGAIQG